MMEYKTRNSKGKRKNRGWLRNSQDELIELNRQLIYELQQNNAFRARELTLQERAAQGIKLPTQHKEFPPEPKTEHRLINEVLNADGTWTSMCACGTSWTFPHSTPGIQRMNVVRHHIKHPLAG